MTNLPTRLSLTKKFQGQTLSASYRKAANVLAGRTVDGQVAKKEYIKALAYKSERQQEAILKKIGLNITDRNKMKGVVAGKTALSPSEIRKIKEREIKKIKYNIAMSAKSRDEAELFGQHIGPSGAIRKSFYRPDDKKHTRMAFATKATSASTLFNKNKTNLSNRFASTKLSVDDQANKMTGAISSGNNNIVRPIGLGGFR
jgi:hypothetical protein